MSATLYRWHWRVRLPERHGELFRVLATAPRVTLPVYFENWLVRDVSAGLKPIVNACLIEFLSDGWRVVTSRNALRRA